MNKNDSKRIVTLPDYIEGQPDNVKHDWLKWEAISYKIDNYPNRFIDVVNEVTGAVRTFDCKCPPGVIVKTLKNHNASKQDYDFVLQVSKEVQILKIQKGRFNANWSKHVFGHKAGEGTILGVRSAELIDLFGRHYTVQEITNIIQRDWGFSIKYEVVKEFYNKNADKIERKKSDYVLKGKDVRLATDAGRLEILSNLAWEMEGKFIKTKSIEVSKELRAIVEQVRKEVKGDEIKLTVEGKIDIQATIQANQSINESLQKLPINMIVVGLAAAKKGINPALLIGSLINSYYSKFNGFGGAAEKGVEIPLPGQFIKKYDWGEIGRINEQIIDIEPIEVFETVTEVKKEEARDKKQILFDLLKQYSNEEK